jgi:diacylglycerol O-acyltransferase
MTQLSGLDALFLHGERPTQPMHIAGLGIYDQSEVPGGRLGFKEILAHIEGRLDRSSTFRRKLARVPLGLDHPYWVDDADFDLEFHIRHIALPEPRDWRRLMIEGARIHSRRIDTTRPLWEWWVIEGLDNVEGVPPGSFAVMFKIHHAAVDGKSGREMIDVAHDRAAVPSEEVAVPAAPWTPAPAPGRPRLVGSAVVNTVKQPVRLARTVGQSVPIVRETLMRGVRNSPMFAAGVPSTRFNGPITAHRVHDHHRISLDDLRTIRAAVPGSTVNDAVVAIVGGALREYLDAHGELPARSLVAGCPISIRPESQRLAGGNQAIFSMIPMGTHIADPIARLREVHRVTSAKKEFTHAVPAHVLTDYAQYVPGSLAMLAARTYTAAGLSSRHRPPFNVVITNVPGWKEEIFFCGARMVTYDGWGPVWDGNGLTHPVTSYRNDVTIAFDAAREMLPDPDVYRDCLRRSCAEHLDAASGRTPAGARAAS